MGTGKNGLSTGFSIFPGSHKNRHGEDFFYLFLEGISKNARQFLREIYVI
jgi:hypothetical protein